MHDCNVLVVLIAFPISPVLIQIKIHLILTSLLNCEMDGRGLDQKCSCINPAMETHVELNVPQLLLPFLYILKVNLFNTRQQQMVRWGPFDR